MTDTPEIARIRAALAAGPTPGPWEPWGSPTPTQFICSEDALIAQTTTGNDVANAGLILSCNPEAMTALLAHIDAQAAEIAASEQQAEILTDDLTKASAEIERLKSTPRAGVLVPEKELTKMRVEFKIDWARAIEDAAIEYADAYTELQCDADNDHQREHLKALKDLRETIKRGLEVAAAQPERKPLKSEGT